MQLVTKIFASTKLSCFLLAYGGKVSINHSIFKNLTSEDAVNLFRCKYDFVDSKIENTFSDALDADFSIFSIY